MRIQISEYTEAHVDQVAAFNQRLESGGVQSAFPARPTSEWLPPVPGRRLFQEFFVAVDEEGTVRGGYILKHQDFQIGDELLHVADYRLPISEGTIDRRFAPLAAQLQLSALGKKPLLYGLGMGGWNTRVTRSGKASGWPIFEVPFLFRVVRPARFLHGIRHLRTRWSRRVVLDLAAFTGLGWVALKGVQGWKRWRHQAGLFSRRGRLRVDCVDEFGDWADELWSRSREQYGMIAVRDAETLRILYPRDDARFIRLRVQDDERLVGWCVLLVSQFHDHKQFGALKVGVVVDALARIADARSTVAAATKELERRGVDLIVTNQSHGDWAAAFGASGYLQGPTNFLFAASPKLAKRLAESGVANEAIYVNRGDGDGPVHLDGDGPVRF